MSSSNSIQKNQFQFRCDQVHKTENKLNTIKFVFHYAKKMKQRKNFKYKKN